MRYVVLNIGALEYANWHYAKGSNPQPFDSVIIHVDSHFKLTQKEAITSATNVLQRESPEWFVSGGHEWTLDLEKLKSSVAVCSDLEWLNGKITVEPEYKVQERQVFDNMRYTTSLVVSLMPEDLSKELYHKSISRTPEELLPSLSKFYADYPDPMKNGFIMMRFSGTKAHQGIVRAIKSTLSNHSLNGLRADDKEYSDELLPNIRTYMHGCGFGIAIFERLLADDFNPNISFEVGYMIALGKPVLFLKDKTLRGLHTDIVGRLYRDFDPQDPEGTIPEQLENWLREKRLI